MAGDELVKLQVSDDLIRGIVTKQVQAAMLTAMGGREDFFEKIVTAVMTMKVDAEGNIGNYNSRNEFQWLDVLIRKMIQQAAREAIKSWIENNQAVLQRAIEKGFQGQTKQLATSFVAGILKSIESSWQFKVDVNFNSNKDR